MANCKHTHEPGAWVWSLLQSGPVPLEALPVPYPVRRPSSCDTMETGGRQFVKQALPNYADLLDPELWLMLEAEPGAHLPPSFRYCPETPPEARRALRMSSGRSLSLSRKLQRRAALAGSKVGLWKRESDHLAG